MTDHSHEIGPSRGSDREPTDGRDPSQETPLQRRAFMYAAGATGMVAVAGCADDSATDENGGENGDQENGDEQNGEENGDEEENGEDSESTALLGEGPTIGLETIAEGLTAPVALETADEETDRRFIVDQAGQIHVHEEDGLADDPFLDVTDQMVDINEDFDERGLLGVAFHPEFADNGQFFVRYSAEGEEPEYGAPGAEVPDTVDHLARVSRFETSDDDNTEADPESEEILLEVAEPQFNHNGGPIAFGPDGYLYIALGDGGGANDSDDGHVEDWYDDNEGGNGQDTEQNLLGSILRIDVDADGEDERAYGIPDDNPLVDADGHLPEYYAWGIRNPWGMSFEDGELLAADVGQGLFESVNHIQAGGNYAWNVWEGTHCFSTDTPSEAGEDCPDTVESDGPHDGESLLGPVIEYPHMLDAGRYADEYDEAGGSVDEEGMIGVSITGGRIYRGDGIDELDGAYVFGDWSRDGDSGGRLMLARPPEDWAGGADENGTDENGTDENGNETENGTDENVTDENGAEAENGNETENGNGTENGVEAENGNGTENGAANGASDQYHPPDDVDLWPLEELSVEADNDIVEDGLLNHFIYGFGRDDDGEVYVLTTDTSTVEGEGYVSRIVPADEANGGADENGADENGADENGTDENGTDENGTDENGNETENGTGENATEEKEMEAGANGNASEAAD